MHTSLARALTTHCTCTVTARNSALGVNEVNGYKGNLSDLIPTIDGAVCWLLALSSLLQNASRHNPQLTFAFTQGTNHSVRED